MLRPKNTKFRKHQKGRCGGLATNLNQLAFGQYGIVSMASGRLSAQVIETIRRSITRAFRRSGKVWIRVFPDISVSEKPAEVRMGKGKGSPSFWVCRIRSGQVLFEMDGVSFEQAKAATELAACKFPFAIRFVTRAQKYSAIAKL